MQSLLGAYGGSDDSDSADDSADDSAVKPDSKEQKKRIALPSASAVFSSTAVPSFLDQKKDEPIIIPTKKREKNVVTAAIISNSTTHKMEADKDDKKRSRDAENAEIQALKMRKRASVVDSSKKTRPTAKDRVKGQRKKGQAGIGSDFRHWKSDAEMVMRQQFD
jgi:hypothetical protein